MSKDVIRINRFFRDSPKQRVLSVIDGILLTERQKKILSMYYIDGHDVNFIADTLFMSSVSVKKELRKIRNKISQLL